MLDAQHQHALMFCRIEGIEYDEQQAEVCRELIAALRFKIENDLP